MTSQLFHATPRRGLWRQTGGLLLAALGTCAAEAAPGDYFTIEAVDDSTGRGVPLVELVTVNGLSSWTDSQGLVAFLEPALMGREVFFHVRSHGYEYPKDLFGNRGLKLHPVPGGHAVIRFKRLNIAERLYRVTGEGIYHDTTLLGRRAPTKEGLLNGQVMGQDTVIATPYLGKIYWCWGDTVRPSYPLGNFGASGAVSERPGRGGLDPNVGVDLNYFVDETGFSRPMCRDDQFGPGLKWIEGLMTLRDERGRERLLARVAAGTGLEQTREWHLAMFNDEQQTFTSLARWDIHDTHDSAHPFRARVGARDYIYLYPNYRVPADLRSVTNLAAYEAFTCLDPGTRSAGRASKAQRSPDGRLRYEWRAGADRLEGWRRRELIQAGLLKPEESWQQLHDFETGQPLEVDRGSVAWNEYRRRWVMIGSGQPGEVWFAEADTPVGPWVMARRIVTHDHYNFYNPTHHPFFDQESGRLIYFEGTYVTTFSDAKQKTPRYDYNQIMYRLTLDDPRLDLPAPVYAVREPGGSTRLMMRPDLETARAWARIESIPFLALPATSRRTGLVALHGVMEEGAIRLRRARPADSSAPPLFYVLPAATDGPAPPATALLYEYRHGREGRPFYAARPDLANAGQERAPEPLGRVWINPMSLVILDAETVPTTLEKP